MTSQQVLQRAEKFPITESVAREQLARLGETPYELEALELEAVGGPMVPKSILNDLRRQAVDQPRPAAYPPQTAPKIPKPSRNSASKSLQSLHAATNHESRTQCFSLQNSAFSLTSSRLTLTSQTSPALHVLVRTLDQLHALLQWRHETNSQILHSLYCDFEDVRRYKADARPRLPGSQSSHRSGHPPRRQSHGRRLPPPDC